MTYLELCKRLVRESGIQGDGPASVTGQRGILLLVTDWIQTAYQEIQTARQNWDWLWQRTEISTTASQSDYELDASISDLRDLTIYRTDEGEAMEGPLTLITYADWLSLYQSGIVESGRPMYATRLPNKSLRLSPTPDSSLYRVQADARRAYHTLASNSDEPLLPTQYHLMIVWRAMVHAGSYQAAPDVAQRGEVAYLRMLKDLEREYLPPVRSAEALA